MMFSVLYESTPTSLKEAVLFFVDKWGLKRESEKKVTAVGSKLGYTGLDLMQLIRVN